AVRLYETRDCDGVSLAYWATTEPAGEVPIESGSKIRLTVAINDKPVRAQLDSGTGHSILSKADAARLGVTPESAGTVAGGYAGGTVFPSNPRKGCSQPSSGKSTPDPLPTPAAK